MEERASLDGPSGVVQRSNIQQPRGLPLQEADNRFYFEPPHYPNCLTNIVTAHFRLANCPVDKDNGNFLDDKPFFPDSEVHLNLK